MGAQDPYKPSQWEKDYAKWLYEQADKKRKKNKGKETNNPNIDLEGV